MLKSDFGEFRLRQAQSSRRVVKMLLLSVVSIAFFAGSSCVQAQIIGDLNADHIVDVEDLRIFSWQWLNAGCSAPDCVTNLDGVAGVTMADFALLTRN